MPERITHFAQWKNVSMTLTTRTSSGADPLTAMLSRKSVSRTTCAVPVTRKVSRKPGTRNNRATCGFFSTLLKVSARRLPLRSGIASVLSSSTRTNPAGSPLGETSRFPASSVDAISMNGECSISEMQCLSSRFCTLSTARPDGSPMTARN